MQTLTEGFYKNQFNNFWEPFEICDCLNNNKVNTLRLRNNLFEDESDKYFAKNILNKKNQILSN